MPLAWFISAQTNNEIRHVMRILFVNNDRTFCFPEHCPCPGQAEDRDQTARISRVKCLRCLNIACFLLHASLYALVVCWKLYAKGYMEVTKSVIYDCQQSPSTSS